MVRDSRLSPEVEQFSFIRTISVDPLDEDRNEDLDRHSSVNKDSRNSQTSEVLALCQRSNKTKSSSLTIDNHTTISDRWYSLDTISNSTLSTVIVVPESELPNKSEKKGSSRYLEKICLIFAGGYFCFVLWWLFGTKNAMFPIAFLEKQETISQADAEFIDYMKQSLEVIDRKVAASQKTATSEEIAASEEKTSEVVYVPVYTPTPTSTPDNNTNLSQPNTLLPPPPPPNTAMNPPVSAIPIKPSVAPSEAVKVKTTPATPSTETSVIESTPQKEEKPEIAAATTKPKMNHTLVGVMELKEGSAALFKIDGVTQRIWLGEKIDNTGWVLDSVANQQVKISYQGKSLTLSVGEQF